MKWLLVIVGVLVVLLLVVVIIGYLLPREHVATSSIVIHQPPETVWMVVRDLGNAAEWWEQVTKVERVDDPEGREVWCQHLKTGPLPLVVMQDDPPRRLVTQINVPDDAAFGGTWTYEIAPVADGSRVRITEAGFINNPFFRFMAVVFFGMHGTMDGYLTALGRRFDEDVTPVHDR